MTGTASRYLFLTRHGEASSSLTESGARQAELLGRRLRDVPFSAIHHGPLPRTTETAHLISKQLGDVPVHVNEAAGDYVPYTPERSELPPESADLLLGFLDQHPPGDPALAQEALRQFTGPVKGSEPRYELVVTHNFLAGWLVRDAQDSPLWRWLAINHGNAALTVLRYAPGRAAALLVFNDTGHLPAELRWTGFPPELHV